MSAMKKANQSRPRELSREGAARALPVDAAARSTASRSSESAMGNVACGCISGVVRGSTASARPNVAGPPPSVQAVAFEWGEPGLCQGSRLHPVHRMPKDGNFENVTNIFRGDFPAIAAPNADNAGLACEARELIRDLSG